VGGELEELVWVGSGEEDNEEKKQNKEKIWHVSHRWASPIFLWYLFCHSPFDILKNNFHFNTNIF
jgi:hypothetical protein